MGTTVPRRMMVATIIISLAIGLAISVWAAIQAVQYGIWTAVHALEVLILAGLIGVAGAVIVYVWLDRHGALTD